MASPSPLGATCGREREIGAEECSDHWSPFHQEEIQRKHIRKAGVAAGIGGDG
jgi:hypothetical protein